ncbi:MAG: YciI family protein [Pirellulaceae bacterium]
MQYICLSYRGDAADEAAEGYPQDCQTFDEWLRNSGYLVSWDDRHPLADAAFVRSRGGRISVVAGSVAAARQNLARVLILEAHDLNQAIQLLSQHPSLRYGGSFELRRLETDA